MGCIALAIAAACCTAPLQAATIEDARTLRVADTAVARLQFSAPVRVLQVTPSGEADVFQIRIELLGVNTTPGAPLTPESRVVPAGDLVPEFTVNFAPGARNHELTLQLRGGRRAIQVRRGANARELDIVFGPAPAPVVRADPSAVVPVPAAAASAVADAAAAPDAAASAPAAAATPPPARLDDAALQAIEDQAAGHMEAARQALAGKRFDEAVNRLNQLLLLPPNRQSQEAQALIGDAWAGAGDTRRARIEYELYLKLHPTSADAPRIATQLAALGGSVPRGTTAGVEAGAAPPRDKPAARSYSGSIAQYYSGGKARSKTLLREPSGLDQTTLTTTNESALVTSVDLGARIEMDDAEVRGVVRGSGSANLSSTSHASSLLSAAYVDYKRLDNSLAVRLGRQSAVSGGLLGLFDGVSLAYPLREGVKLDLMGGVPANVLVSSPSQRLLAAMLELDGLVDKWGGNVYLVDQTSEGYTNRRALGAEVRYSDENWSGYATLDYDLEFREVNAVSLQGSVQLPGQTTLTLLVDDRKAPSLALNNVLIATARPSLKTLFRDRPDLSLAQARALALDTSARAQQAMVSLSHPLSERWQASADLRFNRVGALPKVDDFAATDSTGAQYTGTLQLTGTNLYSSRDINNFNVSMMRTPFFKGTQVSVSNLTGLLNNDLTLEPSLRVYTQRGPDDLKLLRVSPGVRLSYRASRRVNLLGEGIIERSTTEATGTRGTTNAGSFYLGYRYELF